MKLDGKTIPTAIANQYESEGKTIHSATLKGSSVIVVKVKGNKGEQDVWHKEGKAWVRQNQANHAPKHPTPQTSGRTLFGQNLDNCRTKRPR